MHLSCGHGGDSAVARRSRAAARLAMVTPFGGINDAFAGVGRGSARAAFSPGLQVFWRIDDAAAQLSVSRTSAIYAMLLERSARQAKKARCLGRAQEAGEGINGGHGLLRGCWSCRR